jgi:hypothetical protein
LSSLANPDLGGSRLGAMPVVAALVAVAAIVTWPLPARLGSSFPGDYGDPVFVSWVMAWVNHHVARAAFDGFWTANIFFPERGTLAFSEHFIAQSLMVLPVYWASGNAILTYNIAFLLTFVLTGLGTFLLARALTHSAIAATVAAFVAAFNEYRLVFEVAHLHTLSIHWFPFALYALHRYFDSDRRLPLAAAAVCLVLLNLSSVYYMAYCAPFVFVFAFAEMLRTGGWRKLRVWLELWAAAAFVLVLTLPFLLPYIDVQHRLGVQRPLDEVTLFSARLEHYRAALPGMLTAVIAAAVGIAAGAFDRTRRWAMTSVLVLLLLAVWLSLGPVIKYSAEPLGWPSLYALFHNYVPGYSALRVPARFASLFFLFLALLAAFGVAAIERRSRLAGKVTACVVIIVFLLPRTTQTMQIDALLPSEGLAPPPAYLTPHAELPAIYRAVETLRPGAVLLELPFGDPWYDIRYMFFSAAHHRRLLNGYSGIFPPSFRARQRVLARPLLDPGASAQAIGGATHVVVHRQAWKDDTGARVGAWLETFGARLLSEADGAGLYELPVRERFASRAGVRPQTPPTADGLPSAGGRLSADCRRSGERSEPALR